MTHTNDQIVSIIREAFRRISSDGKEPVSPSFTDGAIYDFPYSDIYIVGSRNLDIVFGKALPTVLRPLRQWPIAIYPTGDGETVLVEYASRGTALRNNSTYENRYAGVMKIANGRLDFWREYFNVEWFNHAVGPEFTDTVAKMLPADGYRFRKSDDLNVRRWSSRWVLPEFASPPV